jgi:HD-GYP domain-containing protein (c-di-GMP phosphodiesterase class II)
MRLADLLVALSGVADLGMGLPMGSAARTASAALALAGEAGANADEVTAVYYAALLQHIGCTAYSHEVGVLFPHELTIKQASMATDFTRTREVLLGYLPRITREAPTGDRLRTIRSALLHGGQMTAGYRAANCETAAMIAERIGLSEPIRVGLLHNFEWWNGRGGPRRLRGTDISPVARIVNVAGLAVFFDQLGGSDVARHAIAQRSGTYLDPDLAALFADHGDAWLAAARQPDVADHLIAAEPHPWHTVPDDVSLDAVLRVFGEAVDLKTPFLHGHCTAVADLVARASSQLRLPNSERDVVRRAGLVHDLGRAAISSAVWEHRGAFGADAWQQVRLHAYHTEQIVIRSSALAAIAAVAGAHHERLDGSGYHRGRKRAELPMTARVLAAADAYQAMRSDRPHRAALSQQRAAGALRREAADGRLDADAVDAVLAAAGVRAPPHAGRRVELTDRQLQVLRLVAAGLSNKGIAERLVISPRTAEHHVQDLYARIGVSSRAATALFAMEHGLLVAPEDG